MAYRYGTRDQRMLLPMSIEEYVTLEDPVRAYDAFVDALDLSEVGIVYDEKQVGPPEYDPISMLKLLVYGYSYGIRSSRKLEQAVHHNVSFIWLMGGLRPDHKTIALFRRDHQDALRQVLKQCVRMCLKLGLVEGNVLFVDGTKIKANASKSQTWTISRCEKTLEQVDQQIEQLLEELERIDQGEEGQSSLVQMQDDLIRQEELRRRVREIAQDLQTQKTSPGKTNVVNVVDPESRVIGHKHQSTLQGYNGQLVCDGKHGLIVSTEVVNHANDTHQLSDQIELAEENLGRTCDTAVADAGYYSTKTLSEVIQRGTQVIVPTPQSGQGGATGKELGKKSFIYDATDDSYVCPEGHRLRKHQKDERGRQKYRIERAELCHTCRYWGVCTQAKHGRMVSRLEQEDVRERVREEFEQPESRKIFAKRKEVVEHPFGYIKGVLGMRQFLLRGFSGVRAEWALGATAFNLTRIRTILGGTQAFLRAFQSC